MYSIYSGFFWFFFSFFFTHIYFFSSFSRFLSSTPRFLFLLHNALVNEVLGCRYTIRAHKNWPESTSLLVLLVCYCIIAVVVAVDVAVSKANSRVETKDVSHTKWNRLRKQNERNFCNGKVTSVISISTIFVGRFRHFLTMTTVSHWAYTVYCSDDYVFIK